MTSGGADPLSPDVRNRQFIDNYLEYGIGHHYSLGRMVCNRLEDGLSDMESLKAGLEVSALSSSALDSLVTWYLALLQWKPNRGGQLLVDLIEGVQVDDSDRLRALEHVKAHRTGSFCRSFGIAWTQDDVSKLGIDDANWRYTVDQAKLNIAKALEDLSPGRVKTPRAWVSRYLDSIIYDLLVGAEREQALTTLAVLSEKADLPRDHDEAPVPKDPDLLIEMTNLTGNAAIGLFCLLRLMYITAFGKEPRSPAFVVIWQEMHPARGRGA